MSWWCSSVFRSRNDLAASCTSRSARASPASEPYSARTELSRSGHHLANRMRKISARWSGHPSSSVFAAESTASVKRSMAQSCRTRGPPARIWLAGRVFTVRTELDGPRTGRTGIISTPHGEIRTPAFVAVGDQGDGQDGAAANRWRSSARRRCWRTPTTCILQPGADVVEAAGGLGAFMNWPGPDVHRQRRLPGDVAGRRVQEGARDGLVERLQADDVIAPGKTRLAHVDDDGVTFTSHLNGDRHRFTPEVSMRIQHQLGADIIFAFDELHHPDEHPRLPGGVGGAHPALGGAVRGRAPAARRPSGRHRPPQALFGVVQGAQYEDLRRKAARDLAAMDFDGYGIGGALEKQTSAPSCLGGPRSCRGTAAAPAGHQEPDDMFAAIEHGVDTFDCVSPSRVARNAADLRPRRPVQRHQRPLPTRLRATGTRAATATPARHYTRAYLHHLFKAQGDAGVHPGHHPQRAVHRPDGGPDPGEHRRRVLRRALARTCSAGTTPVPAPIPAADLRRRRSPSRRLTRDHLVGDRQQHHLDSHLVDDSR